MVLDTSYTTLPGLPAKRLPPKLPPRPQQRLHRTLASPAAENADNNSWSSYEIVPDEGYQGYSLDPPSSASHITYDSILRQRDSYPFGEPESSRPEPLDATAIPDIIHTAASSPELDASPATFIRSRSSSTSSFHSMSSRSSGHASHTPPFHRTPAGMSAPFLSVHHKRAVERQHYEAALEELKSLEVVSPRRSRNVAIIVLIMFRLTGRISAAGQQTHGRGQV
jgi:hypothetical protein